KHGELRAMLRQTRKETILESMKKMPQKEMYEFIYQSVTKDPELLQMIPQGDMIKMVSMMPKPNLIDMFRLLDESMLMNYLTQLPEKFLAEAASQVDDNTFGEFLMSKYPDLIAMLASNAA